MWSLDHAHFNGQRSGFSAGSAPGYSDMDEGLLTGLMSIDLKKAFDSVHNEILCQKLEHYGVVSKELSWLKSYLSNRKKYCRINVVDSNINDINAGVP